MRAVLLPVPEESIVEALAPLADKAFGREAEPVVPAADAAFDPAAEALETATEAAFVPAAAFVLAPVDMLGLAKGSAFVVVKPLFFVLVAGVLLPAPSVAFFVIVAVASSISEGGSSLLRDAAEEA